MKLPYRILALFVSAISCVSQQMNSIVEFSNVNEAIVALVEPSSVGEKIHFLRIDCNSTGKSRKCMEVPIANGTVREDLGNGRFKVQLDPGGRIEAYSIVRKHKATDAY
ncbi:MAG TPA: hypothetical protein VFO10_18320 [Oligoflexus sp.]|uniref:hypothetical protein n=1 Tax=Oligoflexus sp. TaxID=1971216 RepID=UPI002D7F8A60|nr:hypothetical protein [Oligoflexus sp.]HET9239222.1 hypothetical protein [Oligoflexus sp.]